MDNIPSSPFRHGTTVEEELAHYKTQYEQLEIELQDFQASSRELEVELEKDVEASEKRERKLKEKVEKLGFEVEEWKVLNTYSLWNAFKRPLCCDAHTLIGETQASEGRGKYCSKHAAKGDHHSARCESQHATDSTRH